MKKHLLLSCCLLFAAPALAQEGKVAPGRKDALTELTDSLVRNGQINEVDWWNIKQLREKELSAQQAAPAAPSQAQTAAKPEPAAPRPAAPAAKADPAAPAAPTVALGKGVTMKIGALLQFRYTYADAAVSATNTSSFGAKTARLKFSGDLPKAFKYNLQLAFERVPSTSQVNSAFYDAVLAYAPRPDFTLSLGHMVVPFGADTTLATDKLDLISRYYAQDRLLNPSSNHDTGVLLSGKFAGDRLQYHAGVFNGKGANYADNDNDKFLYSGRAVWTAFKGKAAGRDALLVLGASGMTESTKNDASSLKASDLSGTAFTRAYRRSVYGGDAGFWFGRYWATAEYIAARLDGQRGNSLVNAWGWHATAGCKLPGDKLELVLRGQAYDPSTANRTKDLRWLTYGLNWYINGHTAKAQLNYTVKTERKSITDNNEIAAQLQLAF